MAVRLHAPTRRELLLGLRRAVCLGPRAQDRPRRGPRSAHARRSCCAARSTGSPWSPRSAIRTGSPCAATRRSCSTARRRPCRSTPSSRSIRPCPTLHRLYKAGQATIVHAAATPYRERSHFDGQDVLENGLRQARLQRHAAGSTARSARSRPADASIRKGAKAFAVGPVTPLVVRGSAPVMSWVPQRLLPASDDTRHAPPRPLLTHRPSARPSRSRRGAA